MSPSERQLGAGSLAFGSFIPLCLFCSSLEVPFDVRFSFVLAGDRFGVVNLDEDVLWI